MYTYHILTPAVILYRNEYRVAKDLHVEKDYVSAKQSESIFENHVDKSDGSCPNVIILKWLFLIQVEHSFLLFKLFWKSVHILIMGHATESPL